jgi:hypothetical protein
LLEIAAKADVIKTKYLSPKSSGITQTPNGKIKTGKFQEITPNSSKGSFFYQFRQ